MLIFILECAKHKNINKKIYSKKSLLYLSQRDKPQIWTLGVTLGMITTFFHKMMVQTLYFKNPVSATLAFLGKLFYSTKFYTAVYRFFCIKINCDIDSPETTKFVKSQIGTS